MFGIFFSFWSIETNVEHLTYTVGGEKIIHEIKTQLLRTVFFKSNIYGLCHFGDLIKYGSLMTTVTLCYYMGKNLHEFPLIIN